MSSFKSVHNIIKEKEIQVSEKNKCNVPLTVWYLTDWAIMYYRELNDSSRFKCLLYGVFIQVLSQMGK
jgi:hypothetical protein